MKHRNEKKQAGAKKDSDGRSVKAESVVQAAIELFARYGYRKTSVDEIAEAAGVSKRTVYLHFDSKEAIFRAMAEYMADLTRERFEAALKREGAATERLTDLLYANYGTTFERFGASEYVQDLEAAGAELLYPKIVAQAQEYEDLLVAFLRSLKRNGEIGGPPPGLTLSQIIRMTMRGATAAKHDPAIRGNVTAYRERLRELALFALAALRN